MDRPKIIVVLLAHLRLQAYPYIKDLLLSCLSQHQSGHMEYLLSAVLADPTQIPCEKQKNHLYPSQVI